MKYILLALLTLSFSAQATCYYCQGTDGTDGVDGANGIDGIDGTSGIDGLNGLPGAEGLSYNNETFNRSMAITGAMSNIPTSSHVSGGHGYTAIGIGVGGYSNQQAVAVGVTHMIQQFSLKGSVGISGSDNTIWGAGGSYTF